MANEDTCTRPAAMPWPVRSPFRMRPGLARLEAAQTPPLFLRDDLAPAYAAQKQAVLRGHRVIAQVGEADPKVLAAIAEAYAAQTGVRLAPEADALALGMQEDFVILHDEPGEAGPDFCTRFLSVYFPSNWAPVEKLGLDFTAIHAPVADNALLQAGARGIVAMAFRQAPMLRHVWLLTPSGDLAQHPQTRRLRWDDALRQADARGADLIDQVFFRVERQTTLPLPQLQRAAFLIRVMVAPLNDTLRVTPDRAAELLAALASMSETVVDYRGMNTVRARLLAELARLSSA
jgi:hypothetical protein